MNKRLVWWPFKSYVARAAATDTFPVPPYVTIAHRWPTPSRRKSLSGHQQVFLWTPLGAFPLKGQASLDNREIQSQPWTF